MLFHWINSLSHRNFLVDGAHSTTKPDGAIGRCPMHSPVTVAIGTKIHSVRCAVHCEHHPVLSQYKGSIELILHGMDYF